MRGATSLAVLAIIGLTGLASPVLAQGKPQTVTIMRVDPQSVATGFRSSKVVGSSVYNGTDQKLGTVDDLIVTPSEQVPYAVLSVGGFLGVGTKLVVVPFKSLQFANGKIVLPDASKDALTALPEFHYAS